MAERQRVCEQLLASTRERLLICVCGVDERDARTLGDPLKRIATIKLQMSPKHEIAIANVARGRPHLRVAREFTRDVGSLEQSIDEVVASGNQLEVLSMDALLQDAAHYFSRHADAAESEHGCYRLLLVLRQSDTAPAVDTNRIGLADSFFSNARTSLDVVYWHRQMPINKAQSTFDQLCSFDSDDPLSNFYFLEVGDTSERLHQVLVLMLSNPTHRVGQHTAEQLLGSVFSPTQSVESGAH